MSSALSTLECADPAALYKFVEQIEVGCLSSGAVILPTTPW